jgi:hypothetical protein
MGFWNWLTGRGKAKQQEEERRRQDQEKLKRQGWLSGAASAAKLRQKQQDIAEEKAFRLFQEIEREAEQEKRRKSDEKASRQFKKIEAEVEANTDEGRFLAGEWETNFSSSNVAAFQWFSPEKYPEEANKLTIEFHDGSIYQYANVTRTEALSFYYAPSKGTWVWDNLRVRGTVFGWKKPYVLLSGFGIGEERVWHQTEESRRRHGLIQPEGEPRKGWHPAKHAWPGPEPKRKYKSTEE